MLMFLVAFASAHALNFDEPDTTIYGSAGQFGRDDAAVGDLNADGFGDFAVASPGFGWQTGRVYVYLGSEAGPVLQTILEGAAEGYRFGTDVVAGDVNGDGYDDLLVGIQLARGSVELYLGSDEGIETSPSATWMGEPDGEIGQGLAVVDVDLDGYGDAVFCDLGQNEIQIHRGRPSVPSPEPAFRLEAPGFIGFAWHVIAADVTGDGHADVVASDPGHDYYTGSVHLFESASGGPSSTPDASIVGYDRLTWFGYRMASTDTDADGYDDLIVGANGDDPGEGRVYVFRGSAAGIESAASTTLEAETPMHEYFGAMVDAGDVNGDGFGDVVVGEPGRTAGAVYAFLGGSGGVSTTAATVITEGPPSRRLGIALAVVDIDGDGRDDAIAGDEYGGGGAVQLYFGVFNGLWPESLVISPELHVPDFGERISAAGDVNGDGFADLLISSVEFADGSGVVFLHLGGPDGVSAVPAVTLPGRVPGNQFGFRTASAGDVNGDGLDDVVVGVVVGDRASVFYGNRRLGLDRIPTVLRGTSETEFGYSVGSAGDVNGDGFDDVVVGAREDTSAGQAFVYHGSAFGLETTPSAVLTVPPGSVAYNLGTDVDSAGDVDGDGYDDVIVGAYRGALLFRGAAAGVDPIAATEFVSPLTGSWYYYGNHVAGAGDVDDDGYDDVVWSYYSEDEAYLAFGGPSGMSGAPDVTFKGEAISDLGSAVDGDFDVDADGYSDVLVAATPSAASINDDSVVYVHTGASDGPSTIATAVVDEAADAMRVGLDIAALGDVNGDGYDDLAVGTSHNSVLVFHGTRDDDGDGSPSLDDCDDLDPAVHPGALEVVGDEVDQNCDGNERCFVDADDDGCRTMAAIRSNDTDCSDSGEALSAARRDMDDASPTPRACMRP